MRESLWPVTKSRAFFFAILTNLVDIEADAQ